MSDAVLVSQAEGVRTLTLNRPEALITTVRTHGAYRERW